MSVRAMLMAAAGSQASSAAAYRYWRIHINALNYGGSQVFLMEVELRGTVGGADLTTSSTPVLESSVFFDGEGGYYPSANTLDGNTASYWASFPGVPHWLRYDLGSAKQVAQVAIYPWAAPMNCPRDFVIQGSADGVSFTNVKSFSGVAAWTGWQAFAL